MLTKNNKILIEDTDNNFLKIAKDKLTSRGFDVRTSSSSIETIAILKEIGPDTLLININKTDDIITHRLPLKDVAQL